MPHVTDKTILKRSRAELPSSLAMTKVTKSTKRKSTVVSTQTYRKMVEEALESAPACALDLHGIYESLAVKYKQYREDSVEVDWRNSIRHCLSINDNFIRILPEAIRLSYFPTDPDNPIFYRKLNDEIVISRSFWTTAALIEKHSWQPFIMNTGSNVKKAMSMKIIDDESQILPAIPLNSIPQSPKKHKKYPSIQSTFNIQPYQPVDKVPIAKRPSITDMLVSEWIDPSSFIDIAPAQDNFDFYSQNSSPMALTSGNQSALFNIAIMDEDDRIVRMRHRLKSLQHFMPNVLGPLKVDFIHVQLEKEPASLPSPLKEVNTYSKDSPQMVSLPPIFNHSI